MQVPSQRDFAFVAGKPWSRLRRRTAVLVLLIVAIASTAPSSAQPSAPLTLIKAARLLDPRTGNVLTPATVLIDGDKIKQVGSSSNIAVPAGAKLIDLGSATLLPGLIDGHTHLFVDVIVPAEAEQDRHYNGLFAPGLLLAIVESPTKRALLGARSAREDLESGITTVRNLGHSGVDGDTELRDAINAGQIPGPRILAAGRKLVTRGSGYVRNLNPALADAIIQGADSIEHGDEATDKQVMQMRAKGIFFDLTPTFYGGGYLKIADPTIGTSTTPTSRTRARTATTARISRVLLP